MIVLSSSFSYLFKPHTVHIEIDTLARLYVLTNAISWKTQEGMSQAAALAGWRVLRWVGAAQDAGQ